MTDAFNLVDEPWLLVQRLDGSADEVSLRQIFQQASTIKSLAGDVPTQTLANLRLLLAVVYRATEVQDRETWVNLWRSGAPVEVIDEYLDTFRDRFDLFDPISPFFQVAGLQTASGKVDGLEKIIADVPNGFPYQTTRGGEGLECVAAGEAARWLVHVHAFDPSGIRSAAVGDPDQRGGKGYPIGTGWAGRLGGIVLLGDHLWQTMLLNLVPLTRVGEALDDDDLAPWERPQESALRTDLSGPGPRGVVQLLTLQSRRVRLVGDRRGVTGVVLSQGDKLIPHNRFRVEPMTAWRYSKPQTAKAGMTVYMPREHSPDRALWRNTAALLPGVPGGDPPLTKPPLTMAWLSEVADVVGGRRRIALQALGMVYGSNESTVVEIINDTVDLSVTLIGQESPRVAALIDEAVRSTENAVRECGTLAANLALASGQRGDDAGVGASTKAAEDAYARIDQPCRRWLSSLTGTADREAELARWERTVHTILRGVGDELLQEAGSPAVTGRVADGRFVNAAISEMWFLNNLAKTLPRARPARAAPEPTTIEGAQ